ncbi:class I SAM-dependent methyltransferase [Reinekea forsetii]|jgi:16S rRNA (guanine1207-N2)-methyltransferase|uniref:Ribosomal RNA small subunit methyltransferase C n=1 Tax=Reinekea forsetii TaxID=1336806 RepID=A0A2K8KNH8_9GAMM|nr:class I SAM-dependent methyltransferase [Reinekea forsetii]ATX76357.1 ribosomal RNA small subunit methyltransferase C [Reinekea forsetii]
MHPTLQLLERHDAELHLTPVHWFDLPEPTQLTKPTDLAFNLNWSVSNAATLAQTQWPCAPLNILFYPKAKERLDWWLNVIFSTLQSGQRLWVVGENVGGIKSLPKRLEGVFSCVKVDSARHCVLFEVILSESFQGHEGWTSYQQGDHTIHSLPGVFSAKRLDKGTEVLLSILPELKGAVLEFGGGAGVLTCMLAEQPKVTSVTAVEIDLLAVRSSLKTIAANQLADRATTLWSAGTEALPEQKFDFIVTNPPFHQGIKTAYGPTQGFFAQASNWLKPRGRLIWVANEFLNYQGELGKTFHSVKVLAHEKGYKVYQANK